MPDTGEPIPGEGEHHIQELAVLYAVSVAMSQAPSEEQALSQALERVLQALSLASGRVFLLDGGTQQLVQAAAAGNPLFLDFGETTIKPGECLCGRAFESGELLATLDADADARITRTSCQQRRQFACAAVPLLAKDHILGVLQVGAARAAGFSGEDLALLRSVGAQIGVATENMRLREEARRAEALTTLIAEMHHRIKNNLQTVADLLSLEMLNSNSPEARRSLHDSINRIKSIAAVHQLLSSEQLRLTDITELARQVSDIALGHLTRPGQHVEARITGPSIFLPSKQATALALALNELLANAVEHGFEGGRSGAILIALEQQGAQVLVSITDDGRGLPPGFNLRNDGGLGLQIIRTLVEKDLAGSLSLENLPGGGSRATLCFYR